MYIAIEGVDGSGKSTVIERLKKDRPEFYYVREPGGTPFAEKLREVVLSGSWVKLEDPMTIQAAILAARMSTSFMLMDHYDIVSDRCFMSAATSGGMDIGSIEKLYRANSALLPKMPDAIVYLRIANPGTAIERMRGRSFRDSNDYDDVDAPAMNARIDSYDAFYEFLSKNSPIRMLTVNAEGIPDAVYSKVRDSIDMLMSSVS